MIGRKKKEAQLINRIGKKKKTHLKYILDHRK